MFEGLIVFMPIFRNESSQTVVRRERLKRAIKEGAVDKRKRVVRGKAEEYPVMHTMFSAVDKHNLGKISKAIDEFALKFPNRKINVLDWGCGWGNSTRQLAEENPRTNVYGFSKDSYDSHNEPGKATILSTSKNAFYRYLKSKKIKFDVVYSNLGLVYAKDQTAEIIKLSEFVHQGGKIFPGFGRMSKKLNWVKINTLKETGLEPDFFTIKDVFGEEHHYFVSLTKVK